jgi:tyrosinase
MSNLYSSTNHPLFWMHHAGLDRLWAQWQGENKARLQDVAVSQITAKSVLWMGQFPPSLAIGRTLDTQNRDGTGSLCYKYA